MQFASVITRPTTHYPTDFTRNSINFAVQLPENITWSTAHAGHRTSCQDSGRGTSATHTHTERGKCVQVFPCLCSLTLAAAGASAGVFVCAGHSSPPLYSPLHYPHFHHLSHFSLSHWATNTYYHGNSTHQVLRVFKETSLWRHGSWNVRVKKVRGKSSSERGGQCTGHGGGQCTGSLEVVRVQVNGI